ncbi:MAG TPA: helix-turn-helix domain-containing protein [Thermoanaerobaculia bacterium]|nr:helix-turn-helix domain-containing protein [Thermoanaerobaculia bacterium]
MTGLERAPHTFTYADRWRLERAAGLYLCKCYRTKSAARVSEFAKELGLTPEYLSQRAMEILGRPLRVYLREKQATYAAWLLRTLPAEITVDEIAIRAAFGTPKTFYRSFRETYGTTPGAFRNLKK